MMASGNAPDGLTAREYLRVSQDRSGEQRSNDEQHGDHVRMADQHGWTLHPEPYSDTTSASKYGRKARGGYAQLVADLEGDRFGADVLLMWESSRGSRKVSEWARLIEACEARAVKIAVCSDHRVYDPADGRDVRNMIDDANDAQYESHKTSKRVTRAMARNAVDGKPHGRPPYGYRRRYDERTRRFVAQEIHEPEAKIVRELYARMLQGHSLRSIAKDFAARGVTHRSGRPFSPQHLRVLAANPAYAARRVHEAGAGSGRTSVRTRPGAQITPACWPAIVDDKTFYGVQALLRDPARKTTRSGRAVHLLSMIARCDVCGGPLSARVRNDVQNARREYVCHNSGHVRVGADDLDDYARDVICAYLASDKARGLLDARGDDEKLRQAEAEAAEITAELRQLDADVEAGKYADAPMVAAAAERGARKRMKDAERRVTELATPPALRMMPPGKDVARRWKSAQMSTKREVARFVMQPHRLGELRVCRSLDPRQPVPVESRVVWRVD